MKANHAIRVQPANLKPGDIVLKLDPRQSGKSSFLGWAIGGLSGKHSEYVHGGLAVGEGRLVEVNGGLRADNINGTRFFANIYLSLIARDLASVSYDVWRHADSDFAETVAIQAYPFVAEGVRKGWGYNIRDAVGSVGLLGPRREKPVQGPLRKDAGAVDIAILEHKSFFCTQFIVWLYNVVSSRILYRSQRPIPLDDKMAYPGNLADALERSSNFTYVGFIPGAR